MLQRGCWIARSIRDAVLNKLGFTLSAGISINKTVAKLSTTYGKPDGQAVTFPNQIEYLLNDRGVIEARSREVKLRLLNTVKAKDEQTYWRLLNIGLPIVALILFGLAYHYIRKRRFAV